MDRVIGIGEYAISNDPEDIIKTFALASCVAVTAYSPLRKVAGMVHVALPSPGGVEKSSKPGYYAITGVPLLINRICRDFGCSKSELEIQLYGGANSINEFDLFQIGKRNIDAVLTALNSMNLKVRKAEIGGTQSRSLDMEVATGSIKVRLQPIRI